jgi:hypothetical protein
MQTSLAINTAPQDGLLIDNQKSYFTNVGYVRSSNFQMELRDVEPQNTANLGGTTTFIIPKAADLLGTIDLMVHFDKPTAANFSSLPDNTFVGWVESLGYAMIESLDFQVGSHSIEKVTGEDLNIMNELMRGESTRHGFHQILKTGRPLVSGVIGAGEAKVQYSYDDDTSWESHDRLIAYKDKYGTLVIKDGKRMVIPLSLLFTSHPSKYLPLAAIANCNDIRIVIKFRPWQELVMIHNLPTPAGGTHGTGEAASAANLTSLAFEGASSFKATSGLGEPQKGACVLRCQYIHLTGAEATALMGKEHVRLMKKWDQNRISIQKTLTHKTGVGQFQTFDVALNFLHPVQMLIITLRKVSECVSSSLSGVAKVTDDSDPGMGRLPGQGARGKNYFAYHGGNEDPNMENPGHAIKETLASGYGTESDSSSTAKLTVTSTTGFKEGQLVEIRGKDGKRPTDNASTPVETADKIKYWVKSYSSTALELLVYTENSEYSASGTAAAFATGQSSLDFDVFQVSTLGAVPTLDVKNFKLTINGHSRHLDGKGLDKHYLCERMMPAMHSNTSEFFKQKTNSSGHSTSDEGHFAMQDLKMLQQFKDRKDIFVYPFAMNPQSENPSGHINFSKVSHANLQVDVLAKLPYGSTDTTEDWQIDVLGLYYNWAAIKDGRMLVTFA